MKSSNEAQHEPNTGQQYPVTFSVTIILHSVASIISDNIDNNATNKRASEQGNQNVRSAENRAVM